LRVVDRKRPGSLDLSLLRCTWCAHFTCILTHSRRLRPRLWLYPLLGGRAMAKVVTLDAKPGPISSHKDCSDRRRYAERLWLEGRDVRPRPALGPKQDQCPVGEGLLGRAATA
jgi:hypothetical protein